MKKQLLVLGILMTSFLCPTVDANSDGWVYTDDQWNYNKSGELVKDTWLFSGDNWYYFDSYGRMLTGWQQISGDWYYLNADGSCACNRWQDGCYLNASGRVARSHWVSYQGDWFYQVDGQYLSNTWVGEYYLRGDGRMARNTWVNNYYVDGSGRCQYNRFIGNYYVGANGKVAFNQWVMYEDNWYYVGRDGKYLCNTEFYSGSFKYLFDETGKICSSEKSYRQATIAGMTVEIQATTAVKYANDDILWEYTPIANYYAAERASNIGEKVYHLKVSDTLIINQQKYRIVERKTGLTIYDKAKFKQYLSLGGYDIALQTCDDAESYIVVYKLVKI